MPNDYSKNRESYETKCGKYLPPIFPQQKRVIALGDIHGDYELAIDMLLISELIKIENGEIIWTGGETYVVQVGDQIDSWREHGPQFDAVYRNKHNHLKKSYEDKDKPNDIKILELFNFLEEEAKKTGGRVFSLIGNHEIMNSEQHIEYASVANKKYAHKMTQIGEKNGNSARKELFKPGNEIGVLMGCSRYSFVIIGDNLFIHGGFVDNMLENNMGTEYDFKNEIVKRDFLIKSWLVGIVKKGDVSYLVDATSKKQSNSGSLFWNRFLGMLEPNADIKNCQIGKTLKLINNGNIIIGHTPQPFSQFNSGINGTCSDNDAKNHVWRIDTGSSFAFDKFDKIFANQNINNHDFKNEKRDTNREPQVLEILDTGEIYKIQKGCEKVLLQN
jgi:hypothetical protein